MPQPRKTDRPQEIHTTMPASLVARVYAIIYSPTEECVPRGALQKFLIRAVEDLLTQLEVKP